MTHQNLFIHLFPAKAHKVTGCQCDLLDLGTYLHFGPPTGPRTVKLAVIRVWVCTTCDMVYETTRRPTTRPDSTPDGRLSVVHSYGYSQCLTRGRG